MRTKALLLAAAFAAVGVATSVAQVYSVNAVGYVNVSVNPGFNMVANPLDAGAGNNTVGKLLAGIQGTTPAQTKAFVFNAATGAFFTPATYVNAALGYQPAASANLVVEPGTGFFLYNPAAAGSPALTLTFVGEVKQGDLSNPLPQGFSIKGSQVPQAGKPDALGLPGTAGDKIYKFNKTTGAYFTPSTYVNDAVKWQPATQSIDVGEGFFLYRKNSAGAWTRTFNVNNPV